METKIQSKCLEMSQYTRAGLANTSGMSVLPVVLYDSSSHPFSLWNEQLNMYLKQHFDLRQFLKLLGCGRLYILQSCQSIYVSYF